MLESFQSEPISLCRLWLLDVAYDLYIPLGMIFGNEKYLTHQWNRPIHRASREQLALELEKLEREGYIYFISFTEAEPRAASYQNYAAILDAIAKRNRELVYGLTVTGGAEWERIVCPNWDWFYEFEMSEEQFTIRASTQEAAEEQFIFEQHKSQIEVEADSVIAKQIHPWPATYWKTLAQGYELSFRGTTIDYNEYHTRYWENSSPEARERLAEILKIGNDKQWHWRRPPWLTAVG